MEQPNPHGGQWVRKGKLPSMKDSRKRSGRAGAMSKQQKGWVSPQTEKLSGRNLVVWVVFCAFNPMIFALVGCQSVPGGHGATAGAAGHLWLAGNGVRDYPVPKTVAAKAVQDAMTHMGMTTVRASHSTVESSLEYKALDGTSVGIHLEEEHPPAPEIAVRTVISVRVGAWGDDIKTDQIFLAISNALSLPVAPGEQAPGRLSPIAVGPTENGASGPVSNSIPGTVIYPSASPSGPFARPQITPQTNSQVIPQTYPIPGQQPNTPPTLPPQGYPQNTSPNYPQPVPAGVPVYGAPNSGGPPNGGVGPLVPIPVNNPYPPITPLSPPGYGPAIPDR